MDPLPPHDTKIEQAALGCVLLAAETGNMAEVDCLMMRLRPGLFYDLKNQNIHNELAKMRMGESSHSVNLVLLLSWIKGREHEFGGMDYVARLPDQTPGISFFDEYHRQLLALARRRWALAESAKMALAAREGDIDLVDLRQELTAALDRIDQAVHRERPRIETWTRRQAMEFVQDESIFLVGKGIICKGEITVVAGQGGVGKSRLCNALAFAGARGSGQWMGYDIPRAWRTLVLQTENNANRIKEELMTLPEEYQDNVRISLPCAMEFSDPAFRRDLKKLWDEWPFEMIIIDNMNDVAREDGRADFLEGIGNIMSALPRHPDTPAVVIIAHLTKGSTRSLKPMTGRKLLDELSGSNVLGAKARTVLTLQHVDASVSTDMRVVFDCAKCNNGTPLPMSAYYRANGEFQPCLEWDQHEWLNPPDEGARIERRSLSKDKWREVMGGELGMTRKRLVALLQAAPYQASQSSAYNWVNAALQEGILMEVAGVIALK